MSYVNYTSALNAGNSLFEQGPQTSSEISTWGLTRNAGLRPIPDPPVRIFILRRSPDDSHAHGQARTHNIMTSG